MSVLYLFLKAYKGLAFFGNLNLTLNSVIYYSCNLVVVLERIITLIVGRVCIGSEITAVGNKLRVVSVYMHILFGYGEGIAIGYHLGEVFK